MIVALNHKAPLRCRTKHLICGVSPSQMCTCKLGQKACNHCRGCEHNVDVTLDRSGRGGLTEDIEKREKPKMTFREKLQREHPEYVDSKWFGGCKSCPAIYGYEAFCESEKNCVPNGGRGCEYCWNREIPTKSPSGSLNADREAFDLKPIDNINHPRHYETGQFECIEVMLETQGIEAVKGFCKCNAFKYLYRSNRKNGLEDMKKAIWYLNKYVELENK